MVALTEAQKKRLRAHSKTQSVAHIKKMASLMRAGKSFSEAHSSARKSDAPKQKQKQRQSQKVVVNIGRDVVKTKRKRRKPRESTRGGSSRVLGQFFPLPPYGFPLPPPPNASASNTIVPRPTMNPFSQPEQVSSSTTNNTFAARPPAAQTTTQITGRSDIAPPPLVPVEAEVPSLERFYTNLPLADVPPQAPPLTRQGSSRDMDEYASLFPRTSLRRRTSSQSSLPDELEYEKVAAATKRYKEENPEMFAQTDFRTKSGMEKRDLADAFRGKSLGKSVFEGLRANVDASKAKKMARAMEKEDTISYASGGGGGGRKMGSLVAPAPGLASKSRNYGAAEEEGY